MSGNKAAYVTEYMATLAGEGVDLTPRLVEVFSGVLQRQLEEDEAGKIIQKANFETLAKVFTFVSSPVGDRPATPLAYAQEDLDAAKAAAEGEDVPVGDITDLLSAAQSKSVTISGIDHDTLVPLNSPIVSALYEGDSWLNFQDVSDPITYSFNEDQPPEYNGSDTNDWQPVASHVRDVIDEIMSNTDGIIQPEIEKVSSDGQIRFNMVETLGDTAAYAYMPSSFDIGGDVFLGLDIGTAAETGNVEPYGTGRSNIVHELGHALGLEHPLKGPRYCLPMKTTAPIR